MTTPAPTASFLKVFLALVLTWAAGFNALSVWLEPVTGDLTRIGSWAERDFGGNGPPDPMPVRGNGLAGGPPPDVLVLGDSFSAGNLWQTALAEATGLEPSTCLYGAARSLAGWVRLAERQPARTWLLQVVERHVVRDWAALGEAAGPLPAPHPVAPGRTKGRRAVVAWNPDYAYLARAAWNHRRLAQAGDRLESGDTAVLPLTREDLFSCAARGRLLYLRDDDRKATWSERDLLRVEATLGAIDRAARRCGARLLVVAVPDKSTTYGPWLASAGPPSRYEALQRRWTARGLSTVDLLTPLREALPGTPDLYLPNDTHLGPVGYRRMAAAVARALATLHEPPTP
ncbi:MAG: hypothetical protein VKS61_11120 [Candidatus Sericytochromatia bacterium]|nr:hypothetical protein [Candidatus Sericytochromatia bacterium]